MSDLRSRFDEYYSKRAKAFADAVKDIDAPGIPELHVPLYGSCYEQASLKVGFIGRDTKTWGCKTNGMNAFIKAVNENPIEAIHRLDKAIEDLEGSLGWTNRRGTFGAMVMRLLAGFYEIPEDWKSLLRHEKHATIRRSFFWANANSVECFQSTPRTNMVPLDVWQRVKKASEEHFDSLAALIEVFSPDVVIIMSSELTDRFNDVFLKWDDRTFGGHLAFAVHPATNTRMFWTDHPGWLNKNHLYDVVIEEIIKRVKMKGCRSPE